MSNQIKLETYSFQIKRKNRDEYLNMDNLTGENIDSPAGEILSMTTLFQNYLTSIESTHEVDDVQKKSFQYQSESLRIVGRAISGFFKCGEFGSASDIINLADSRVVHQKQTTHADVLPFYFLIYVPQRSNKGYLIFQRTGVHGIYGIFLKKFGNFIENRFDGYKLVVATMISPNMAQGILDNGSIHEITLRRNNLPGDIADRLNLTEIRNDIFEIELKIKARRGRSFNPLRTRINNIITDNTASFDLIPLRNLGFDGTHNTSIKVRGNSENRTIDLSDTLKIRPYFDIDNSVAKNPLTNHPVFTSIDTIARNIATELFPQ